MLSIVGRAHEGRAIFATDEDRGYLTDRLRRVFVAGAADLLDWAVLLHHDHLVIRVRGEVPGALFQRLNTVVARRERRRRGDHGAVFQDRSWSARVEGEGALLRLLTYVLGNPVHHGVVPTAEPLESYPWTACPEVLGLRPSVLVDARRTLEILHPAEDIARRILREAMAERAARWRAQRDGVRSARASTRARSRAAVGRATGVLSFTRSGCAAPWPLRARTSSRTPVPSPGSAGSMTTGPTAGRGSSPPGGARRTSWPRSVLGWARTPTGFDEATVGARRAGRAR